MNIYKELDLCCVNCGDMSDNVVQFMAHEDSMQHNEIEHGTAIELCDDCIGEAYSLLMK